MGRFDELLQEIVNLDYSGLLEGAKQGLADSFVVFKRLGCSDDAAVNAVVSFLAAAIAVDGTFSAREQKLIDDLFDDVDFMDVLKTMDEDMLNDVDELVDALPPEDKGVLCLLAIYIISVDKHINPDEYTYLMKLID